MRKLAVLLALCLLSSGAAAKGYDVVVAGGGTGGMAAAIQAARMGASVLVAEPSGWVGGQAIAAGVSTMDDMNRLYSGLYLEFLNKVRAHYAALGKSIGTCYWSDHTVAFEPFVGHKLLLEMAGEGGNPPEILLHASVVAVEREGRTVRGVTIRTPEGERRVACKVLIDATEYGDVLPLAGARYRAGNSVSPEVNPDAMIQDITWTAVLRRYPDGVPERLRSRAPLPGYERARATYQKYLARDGTNFNGVHPIVLPTDLTSYVVYRGLPNSFESGDYDAARPNWGRISKTGLNMGNDYPGDDTWKGRSGLPVAYLEDPALRAQVERDALIKTLHGVYYIQNELGGEGKDWSVDEAEYGELPDAAGDLPEEWREVARHLPPIPYVRESRRVLGDFTLTSQALQHNSESYHDGRGNHEFPDAIAIGCYALDLHHATEDQYLEWELGERQISMRDDMPASSFQVPMRVLIPEDLDGLLAAEKNLSMSRLASGALRLQPITIMTGQAAGALAALSVRHGVPPRRIHALLVQRALLEAGVILSLCPYRDVPPEHPFHASVQLSNLYGLIEPRAGPSRPRSRLHFPFFFELQEAYAAGLFAGNFGVEEPVPRREAAALVQEALNVLGKRGPALTLEAPERPITRGEFAQLLRRGFGTGEEGDDAILSRGEAADRLIQAMEAFCEENLKVWK